MNLGYRSSFESIDINAKLQAKIFCISNNKLGQHLISFWMSYLPDGSLKRLSRLTFTFHRFAVPSFVTININSKKFFSSISNISQDLKTNLNF